MTTGPARGEGERSPASSWPGLAASAERAARAGCARIGTEHLLLTLLDPPHGGDEDSSSAQPWSAPGLLRRAGLSQTVVLVVVEAVYGPGPRPRSPGSAVEPSDRARTVLDGAAAIAAERGADSTPTDDDVLAALISCPGGVAAAVLEVLGVTTWLRRAYEHPPSRP
jgi:hypothetical protein